MFASGFRRVFHFHLKKCGGTSLNAWLAWHQPDDRLWNDDATERLLEYVSGSDNELRNAALVSFSTTDAFGTHLYFRPFAPDGTLCVTVLRDPRQRILSQIADWRREARAGQAGGEIDHIAFSGANSLTLPGFLATLASSPARFLVDNYITRALAAGHTSHSVETIDDAAELLPAALKALEHCYDVVGVTEELSGVRAAIAETLGLVRDDEGGGRQNVAGSDSLAEEVDGAADELLDRLTCHDRVLYARAKELFRARHAEAASTYDEHTFEERHGANAVARLRPFLRDGYSVVSVKGPIIGSGVWGRDAAGTELCSVWTGPGTRTVLYLPCPAGEQLVLKLWIRGYAEERLRGQLRFEIDDVPTAHRFTDAPGWREAAFLRTRSVRPFVKIAMLIDETLTSDDAAGAHHDARRRGVAFDSYGWSIDVG